MCSSPQYTSEVWQDLQGEEDRKEEQGDISIHPTHVLADASLPSVPVSSRVPSSSPLSPLPQTVPLPPPLPLPLSGSLSTVQQESTNTTLTSNIMAGNADPPSSDILSLQQRYTDLLHAFEKLQAHSRESIQKEHEYVHRIEQLEQALHLAHTHDSSSIDSSPSVPSHTLLSSLSSSSTSLFQHFSSLPSLSDMKEEESVQAKCSDLELRHAEQEIMIRELQLVKSNQSSEIIDMRSQIHELQHHVQQAQELLHNYELDAQAMKVIHTIEMHIMEYIAYTHVDICIVMCRV